MHLLLLYSHTLAIELNGEKSGGRDHKKERKKEKHVLDCNLWEEARIIF